MLLVLLADAGRIFDESLAVFVVDIQTERTALVNDQERRAVMPERVRQVFGVILCGDDCLDFESERSPVLVSDENPGRRGFIIF